MAQVINTIDNGPNCIVKWTKIVSMSICLVTMGNGNDKCFIDFSTCAVAPISVINLSVYYLAKTLKFTQSIQSHDTFDQVHKIR